MPLCDRAGHRELYQRPDLLLRRANGSQDLAGIWFARKILRTIRASQEQVGALVKLSVTGSVAERHSSSVIAERTLTGGSPYWLTPPEPTPAVLSEPAETGPTRWKVARHSVFVWLQTPMSRAEVAPWRRVV